MENLACASYGCSQTFRIGRCFELWRILAGRGEARQTAPHRIGLASDLRPSHQGSRGLIGDSVSRDRLKSSTGTVSYVDPALEAWPHGPRDS